MRQESHIINEYICVLNVQSTKSKLAAQKIDLWLAITPFTMTQWSKVRGALENLGNSLYDGHWNFPFMAKGSWENKDKKFQQLKNFSVAKQTLIIFFGKVWQIPYLKLKPFEHFLVDL